MLTNDQIDCITLVVTGSIIFGYWCVFYLPPALKGSWVLSPERAAGRQGRQAPLTLTSIIFHGSFLNYHPTISDEFDHGNSASLNMRIMANFWRIIFFAFSNFAYGKSPLALSRPKIFTDHFEMWQEHLWPYDLGRVRLWGLCLNKCAHNGPLNEVINLGIPLLIFQA